MDISNQDWKLYRLRRAAWQEAYMEQLLQGYHTIISDEGIASTRFWQLHKRITQDAQRPGVVVSMSRSHALYDIAVMLHDGVITYSDLEGFSNESIAFIQALNKTI